MTFLRGKERNIDKDNSSFDKWENILGIIDVLCFLNEWLVNIIECSWVVNKMVLYYQINASMH